MVSPTDFITSSVRCPECAKQARREGSIRKNYLSNLLRDCYDGIEYEWLEEYKGDNKLKHRILHKECNKEYKVRPNDFQQGYRCPFCAPRGSQIQKKVYDELKEIYNGEVLLEYSYPSIPKKNIDIYIPEFKIGFEYNGTYWHSDKILKDKDYHLNRLEEFKGVGIQLYYIDEVDWLDAKKHEIWLDKFRYLTHSSEIKSIYARNLTIYEIDFHEAKEFLNNNHIQGFCQSSYRFGLADADTYELYALLTFGKGRTNTNRSSNDNEVELLRYCTKINYSVVGGFSKLLKFSIQYFNEYTNFKQIFTYANRSFSNGNLYTTSGFKFHHVSKPSYYYIYKKEKHNRFEYRKSNLEKLFKEFYNDSLTEFEILDKVPNMYRIWNCGNFVYTLDIN